MPTYTLGVIENAIDAIYNRIKAYNATGKTLASVKSIVVGQRPRETGSAELPRITMNIVDFSESTVTIAKSAGQKSAALRLEFRIAAEKVRATNKVAFANNCLFDKAGGGAIPIFQWLLDALTYTVAGSYNPTIDLHLDAIPDATFNIEDHSTEIEMVVQALFTIRFTQGKLGGVITPDPEPEPEP